jgi:hypothetical protein
MVEIGNGAHPPVRTVLEVKIRERNMTLEEFADYIDTVARDHPDTGTLSLRHLQRLITGRVDADRLRPATRRLLEYIFRIPIGELLQRPSSELLDHPMQENAAELDRLISTAHRIDGEAIRLFSEQIDNIRKIDRRFGAAALLGALRLHAQQIEQLMQHSTGGTHYRALAVVLTDANTLAGWQSLDRGEITASWQHYNRAADAARAAESPALLAHAVAERAVVLADINRGADAADLSGRARALAADTPPLLRSWLAAAHGEALAAVDRPDASLRAFDTAQTLLPDPSDRLDDGPYLALDSAHLNRWRGHALARFGRPDATTVLRQALDEHDAEFTRAEAGLRADLVLAHLALGEYSAARHELAAAQHTADMVGSARQHRRLARAAAALAS